MPDLKTCAIHTMTHKPWSLAECCERYAAADIGGISVWRNVIEPIGIAEAARIVRSSGLKVPALVRGGFFAANEATKRSAAIDDNKRCIDEAAAIGAEMVVLVVGAVVGMPLADARRQVAEGIGKCIDYAASNNVKLAIEPLHPMYAADRSCINRMKEARLVCEQLQSKWVGIACDVYHVWWDPDLQDEIQLAGQQGTLFGFHVCDWRPNTRDLLNDRGLMGEGAIDIKTIRGWVEATGFRGFNEVEIFSTERWAGDQDEYLKQIVEAYTTHV
ncbi:MAG TPA: sugar phosphate isomerase/epimerase family protein [Tepidisphaeraceae bacterium]|jgi:sugar phosphate isomerase/epimerase|nr:sugar phosphate isomerase/epimerase family protein [Tepidisphaeraceae bacterium]